MVFKKQPAPAFFVSPAVPGPRSFYITSTLGTAG